jgi:uncharacterized protein (TIGR03066 family)
MLFICWIVKAIFDKKALNMIIWLRCNFLLVFLFVSTFSTFDANAQKSTTNKLIGVWQVNTAQQADAWKSNYRFYKDGTFKYTFNQYDDRGRIIAAKGIYRLNGNKLYLTIKSRLERVGGYLTAGSAGFQSEELVLEGDKIVEIKQGPHEPIEFELKWFTKDGVKGFELQSNKYYFISVNPNNQDN